MSGRCRVLSWGLSILGTVTEFYRMLCFGFIKLTRRVCFRLSEKCCYKGVIGITYCFRLTMRASWFAASFELDLPETLRLG